MAKKVKRNGEVVVVSDRRGVDPDISGSWENMLLEGTVERAARVFTAAGATVNANAAEAALKGTLSAPGGDWLVLVELHGHAWVYVGGIGGDPTKSAEEAKSLAIRAKGRVLVVGHEDVSGVAYARVYDAAGEALLDYESDGDETRFGGTLRPRSWLRQFEAGEAAVDGITRELGAFVPEFRCRTGKGRIKIETGQPDVLTPANVKAVALIDLSSSRAAVAARANGELLAACKAMDVDRARAALAAGADVGHVDPRGWTALEHVIRGAMTRREEAVALLGVLCAAGVDLDGRTPGVPSASELVGDRLASGDRDRVLPVLEALHAAGADLTLSGIRSKETPMTRAAARGQIGCVKYLQEIGVDPNAVDARGNNALQAAREMRRVLRRLGAGEKDLKGVDAVIAHLSPRKAAAGQGGGGKAKRGRRAGA